MLWIKHVITWQHLFCDHLSDHFLVPSRVFLILSHVTRSAAIQCVVLLSCSSSESCFSVLFWNDCHGARAHRRHTGDRRAADGTDPEICSHHAVAAEDVAAVEGALVVRIVCTNRADNGSQVPDVSRHLFLPAGISGGWLWNKLTNY